MKLSENARYILAQRYLLKDENGKIKETPSQLFRRTAKTIAKVELKYGKSKTDVKALEKEFYRMISNLEFLPNSPTLMNAGTNLGQLSACFVLPVPDDIKGIFEAVTYTAIIHKSGGGTGFSFNRLRPKNDAVKSTGGVSSGPISFMQVFNCGTDVIKQGGKRRGANMGVLRVDHPDIFSFIVAKEKEGILSNFNLSVAVTNKFMEAVQSDGEFDLINPRTGQRSSTIKARAIWSLLTFMSWNNGEPAVIFIDKMNEANPTKELGEFETTNPCGEQPLLPYESCNLGSINLSKFIKKRNCEVIDWNKLKKAVRLAVRFLDNVIDVNKYPLPQIEEITLGNRKIGLGIMGWADLLMSVGIKYDSDAALDLAKKTMKFIQDAGREMSRELAKEKGSFPNKDKSIYKNEEFMRNATITTLAPTGTISLIAGCSQSIEPIFAIAHKRNVQESLGRDLFEINFSIKTLLKTHGLWNAEIEKKIIETQCQKCLDIPDDIKKIIVTAHQVSPEWHVKTQAAFQQYTDNAVSKTVNLPYIATVQDIEKIYLMAYKLGCKGITVYRNGSRKAQLLEVANGKCPTCD